MLNVPWLLNEIRAKRNLASDSALARALHVTPQTVWNWRNGVSLPDTVSAARIAQESEQPLGKVLASINEAREITPDAKAVWRRFASIALVTLASVAFPAPAPTAEICSAAATQNDAVIYIMRSIPRGSWTPRTGRGPRFNSLIRA